MNLKALFKNALLALVLVSLSTPGWSEDASATWEKTVFHVDELPNVRWAILLANSYLDDRPGAKVVVVTYGPGIDFLLKGAKDIRGNPFAPAVAALVERGVELRICAATLDARGIDRGTVLDSAVVVPSGVSEIARLQIKEGYAYLKP